MCLLQTYQSSLQYVRGMIPYSPFEFFAKYQFSGDFVINTSSCSPVTDAKHLSDGCLKLYRTTALLTPGGN